MDWFSWLSQTDLDPSLVYEYARTFSHNELVEDDIAYFSHEFLQSMGVSIAKHRLEILKLARKNKGSTRVHPILWLMFVLKRTKNYVTKHIQTWVHRESSRLSVVSKRNHSLRWKVAMLQRNKRRGPQSGKPEWPMLGHGSPMFVSGDGVLMLTNGSPMVDSISSGSGQSSCWVESEANGDDSGPTNPSFSRTTTRSPEGEYWSSSTEEIKIKWDSMFKNLNPT
ncbi:hypothetical protein ACS0TY_020762 [Phlomoides rotata]